MAIDFLRSEPEPTPRWRELTILAQDPAVTDRQGRIVRAKVRVPFERLEPGPRGHRFAVVDYDATRHHLEPPTRPEALDVALDDDRTLVADPAFRAQNAYAIAARTLAAFESALGRRLPWAFGGHQLTLVPAAFEEANAYYDPDSQAILFGYFDPPGRARVHTSLSHDIVAHETTHAILDGLRPRFEEPGLPDQTAFHEAFADIVALLSVFAVEDLVRRALGEPDAEGRIPVERVDATALRDGVLLGLAEEMGEATTAQRGTALRRSVKLDPFKGWRDQPDFDEPHRRGEILVAAVTQALLSMWLERLGPLTEGVDRLDRDRAAEEGTKVATHLLSMAIRAIDYCPPLEFAFEDFLDALLVSDGEVAPDDEHRYRAAVEAAFGGFGITRPEMRIVDLASVGGATYEALHFEELRSRRDELYRFIWTNRDLLAIPTEEYLLVEGVTPAARLGPDGFVVRELVATYVQFLEGTFEELADFARARGGSLGRPAGLGPTTRVRFVGGGTLIFDQFGRAKYHQRKDLYDWTRQQRRLEYLVANELSDTVGRYGFSLGIPQGQRFAILHEPGTDAKEMW